MLTRDQIKTAYINARELVRANNPKAARSYVLLILNNALESYLHAPTMISKIKTAAFMDQWIAVSRDLYEKGVTERVLTCFALTPRGENSNTPSPARGPLPPAEQKVVPAERERGEIDYAGLMTEAQDTQGWCADVFQRNKSAIVEITCIGNGRISSGTGFIISEGGYLLTNDHVVFDEAGGGYFSKISMKMQEDKKKIKVEVLFSDKKTDVALCKFDTEETGKCQCVRRIADYSTLLQGAECLLVGNGFGMGLAPGLGVVRFTKDAQGNLVHTAPSNPGDSGGPIFNRKGECVGINKSKTVKVNEEAADGFANATPMDTIESLLLKWCKGNNIEL